MDQLGQRSQAQILAPLPGQSPDGPLLDGGWEQGQPALQDVGADGGTQPFKQFSIGQ
jgi:hypothetical protein